MTFCLAEDIEKAYYEHIYLPFVIYGYHGVGKSSYACQVAAEVYGSPENPDFEKVKEQIVFTPDEFLEKVQHAGRGYDRHKCIIWDDAGLWLYTMDFHDPLVKAVVKYLNVARTDVAAVLFTTPSPKMLVNKVFSTHEARTVWVKKLTGRSGTAQRRTLSDGRERNYRYREARIYNKLVLPDMKKEYHFKAAIDRFSANLPDDFFEWYREQRASYAETAKGLIEEEMLRKVEKARKKKEGRDAPPDDTVSPSRWHSDDDED